MADEIYLTDVKFYEPNAALGAIMAGKSGRLRGFLAQIMVDLDSLYAAHVHKRSGDLSRSGITSVEDHGGHDHDRMQGVLRVGGDRAVGVWKSWRNPNPGDEFFYGVLHDLGSTDHPPSGRDFPAAKDLYDVTQAYAEVRGRI